LDLVEAKEAIISGGATIALGTGVTLLFKEMNSSQENKLKELEARALPVRRLHAMLRAGAPPGAVLQQLDQVEPHLRETCLA
jgi:hypothetical protein